MLSRFDKRRQEANLLARKVMEEYGYDYENAAERVFDMVDGRRWMERLVLKEMKRLAQMVKVA